MDSHDRAVEVRRTKLRQWIDTHFRSVKAFADKYGLSQSDISGLLRNKSFGSRRARNLEAKVGMPPDYLETEVAPGEPIVHTIWPFEHSTYRDYLDLPPIKRKELDIRISEYIAGAMRTPQPSKKRP